jgi:hypothetical protein
LRALEVQLDFELLMYEKVLNALIFEFFTPLDSTHIEIFLKFVVLFSNFFNSNLKTRKIFTDSFFYQRPVIGQTGPANLYNLAASHSKPVEKTFF